MNRNKDKKTSTRKNETWKKFRKRKTEGIYQKERGTEKERFRSIAREKKRIKWMMKNDLGECVKCDYE